MSEKEKIEKHILINDLFIYAVGINEMLDEKIEVLEAIKAGRNISEIPKFYDVLELMPKEGIWD